MLFGYLSVSNPRELLNPAVPETPIAAQVRRALACHHANLQASRIAEAKWSLNVL